MKHGGEARPEIETAHPREREASIPPPPPERSPDQDDFDASFRAGVRSMGELLRRRRKKQ